MVSETELALFFLHLPGAGPATYWKAIEYFHSLREVFRQPQKTLETLFKSDAVADITLLQNRPSESALLDLVRRQIDWCEQQHVHILCEQNDNYPALLRETKRPPHVLFVRGNCQALALPQIAMVGSRTPSPIGAGLAFDFANQLATSGFAITSGLALGTDTHAHRGALRAGGKTIAVLGSGIDHVYPLRNRELAEIIVCEGGTLVSEFPLGTQPIAHNFPRRNRVISGLSFGTLVVEAAEKSGSLITAHCALEQNREVFAIPGSVQNPLSKGCHALIREGAKLVETAADIVEELQGFLYADSPFLQASSSADDIEASADTQLNDVENLILQSLGFESTSTDILVERTNLSVADLLVNLLTLEMKGFVANLGGGYMRTH